MRFLLAIFLLVSPINDINKIARTNELKKEAREAYRTGNYDKAIHNYHYLLDSMGVDDDNIRMNLANAYYASSDTTEALSNYSMLLDSNNKEISSIAYQQLGVIKNKQKKQEEALADFKQALRENPYNEEARYNYELLKKLLDEQKEKEEQEKQQQDKENPDKKDQKDQEKKQDQQQQQDQQKEDQEKKDQDQQQQEKQDQEGKESEEQKEQDQKSEEQKEGEEQEKKNDGQPQEPTDEQQKQDAKKDDLNISPEKLKEMNISEEKAKMILEAMRNQEIQYFQQNKRKAKQKPPSGKPDW